MSCDIVGSYIRRYIFVFTNSHSAKEYENGFPTDLVAIYIVLVFFLTHLFYSFVDKLTISKNICFR